MRSKLAGAFVFCVAAMWANHASAAETISDANLGFSFVLPDGFTEIPRRSREGRLHRVFVRISTEDLGMTTLGLLSTGGPMSPGQLDRKTAEQAARKMVLGSAGEVTKFEYRPVNWKGLELEAMVMHARGPDQDIRVLSAQVPLAKEAVVLSMGGAVKDETMLFAEFAMLLNSVEGKSNWLMEKPQEQDASTPEFVGRIVGALVGPAVIVFLVWRRRRSRAERSGKAG